ncbi:MAG: sigma-54-dependent Fis family transcriptional regulator [Dehalobacterium sp.]
MIITSHQMTRDVWKNFVQTGNIVDANLKDYLINSWRNCIKIGVNPFQKRVPQVPNQQELLFRRIKYKELIEISLPFMEQLYKFVAGSGFVVTLADADGYILKIIGDQEVRESIEKGNFREGICWSEELAGTNAIGTSIKLNQPIQVLGYEHFCICSHNSTCSAAPIHDLTGQIIGVLNMTATYEKVHSHTLGMVVAAVHAIENHLKLRESQKWGELINEYLRTIIDSISGGLFAIDNFGNVTYLNKEILSMLDLSSKLTLGRNICNIFPDNESFISLCLSGYYVTDHEVTINTQHGTNKFTATIRPIKNSDGKVNGVVIIINEIIRAQKLAHKMIGAKAKFNFDSLIGNNPEFLKTIDIARVSSKGNFNVILLGESGTGKDVFAQCIHNSSDRSSGPFVAINCGALPRELIGSELFGYSDGAFTGAKKGGKPGKFELADGGTIFLDEIGEMPLDLQATLLRILENKSVIRIGGHEIIPVDVRIITATNKDLMREVIKGLFRSDLYYRLNVVNIKMVPLRQRKDDIPILLDHFVKQVCTRHNIQINNIHPDFINALLAHNWPGNIRELLNTIEQAVVLAKKDELSVDLLPNELHKINGSTDSDKSLKDMEKELILELMEEYQGNISKISLKMGISRTTLYRKLYIYGLK